MRRVIYKLTYLSDKGWKVLMFEYNGQNLFGESGLVGDVECATRVCPKQNGFVLFTLN